MSEVRSSPPDLLSAVDEEQVRPVSEQPSTSSARMQEPPPPLLEAGDEGSPDSASSGVEVDILSALGEEYLDPVSQQPSTSSARMQEPPPPLFEASDDGSPDSVTSSFDQEIMRFSAGAARSRQWSPQPSPSPAMMPPKPQPLVKADEPKWNDQVAPRGGQNLRSSWVNRTSRPWSPQPSTSSAGMQQEQHPFYDPLDLTGDHMYAQDLTIRKAPAGSWEARSSSPQPSTSSAGMHFDLKQFGKNREVKSADSTDSDYSLNPRNNSTPWPWSPTPSTSSAAMMLELELAPVEEGASGSIYSRVARNVSAPLGGERLRPWSPQPTTSSQATLNQPEIPVLSLTDEVTGEMMPIRQTIDYSEIGRNISVPINKRLRRWSTSKQPTITAEATSSDADAENTSATPLMGTLRRWPPQRLAPPAAVEREQLEMQNLADSEAFGVTLADADLPWVAQNLSVPSSERKKRPWSPQPSTSRAALMQLKLMPLMEAIDSNADSFSMSIVQNINALVEEKNRLQRSQQSTSSPPMQSVKDGNKKPAEADSSSSAQNISVPAGEGIPRLAPEPSTSAPPSVASMNVELPPVKEPVPKNPANSVYAHVQHNISNIPQLRGLKAGRRHGRLRRLYTQNKIHEKYGPMIEYIGPMVAEESAKQQTQHILIASALDHFANTINQIADNYEGKVDTEFAERLEEFRKRMENRREKRRKRNPNATEEARSPSPPKYSDEEINRRLREETEAAVEALLTGDRSKESAPDRFAEIIKSFQDAYDP